MSTLVEYFWLLCAGWWMLIIHVFWRTKFDSLIRDGIVTEEEVGSFQTRVSAAIGIPCVLLQLFQVVGGTSSPVMLAHGFPDNIWAAASWIVSTLWCVLLLYWIWLRDGAEEIAKYASILRLSSNVMFIRLLFTATILLGAGSVVIRVLSR